MAPTIQKGDFLIVRDLAQGESRSLRRGDIVMFRSPNDPRRLYAKRIVALAGDEIRVEADRLLLNAHPVHEPCATWTEEAVFKVAPDYKARSPELFDVGPNIIPVDTVYVLSDNRSDGSDSRAYGSIPSSALVGRVLFTGE